MNEWDAKLIGIAKELKRLLAERGMAPSDSEPMDCDEVESACKILQTGMDLNEGNLSYGEYCTSLYDVGNPTDEELKEIEESINQRTSHMGGEKITNSEHHPWIVDGICLILEPSCNIRHSCDGCKYNLNVICRYCDNRYLSYCRDCFDFTHFHEIK